MREPGGPSISHRRAAVQIAKFKTIQMQKAAQK
jgi:hypothetical protein